MSDAQSMKEWYDLLIQIWVFSVVSSLFSELRISALETMEKIVRFQHFLKLEKKCCIYIYITTKVNFIFEVWSYFHFQENAGFLQCFDYSSTGCPKKHGNSVMNSISSLLWISIVIPNFRRHNIIMSGRVYFMKRVKDV